MTSFQEHLATTAFGEGIRNMGASEEGLKVSGCTHVLLGASLEQDALQG